MMRKYEQKVETDAAAETWIKSYLLPTSARATPKDSSAGFRSLSFGFVLTGQK